MFASRPGVETASAGLAPDAAVIVATVRALKMNGGVAKSDLAAENVAAVRAGAVNLVKVMQVGFCLMFG